MATVRKESESVMQSITPEDCFESRHIGPTEAEQGAMLSAIGCSSLDELISKVVPSKIQFKGILDLAEYT